MKRLPSIMSVLLAVGLLAMLALIVSAAPVAPAARVDFAKEVSHQMPQVGEVVTFRLRFGLASGEMLPMQVRVVDPNPAPAYLEILTPTITGGAWYSPTIDGVVWEDTLVPGDKYQVSFQVRVLGLPDPPPATGYVVVNTATIADLNTPGSLPEQMARATVRLGAPRVLLPVIVRGP